VTMTIINTISVYLAVYKGIPMDDPRDDEKPKQRRLPGWFGRGDKSKTPVKAPAKPVAP